MAQKVVPSPTLNSSVAHDHDAETPEQKSLRSAVFASPPMAHTTTEFAGVADNNVESRLQSLHQSDMRRKAEIDELSTKLFNIESQLQQQNEWSKGWDVWAKNVDDDIVVLKYSTLEEVDEDRGILYNFKIKQEVLWALGTTIGTVILTSLTNVENITDWKAWLIGLGAALIRAVVAFFMSLQTKPKSEPDVSESEFHAY